MGYDKEVDMIAEAHRLELLTCPYAFTEDEAKEMVKAGADVIVAHMGLTSKGTIGAKRALSLEEAADKVQRIHDAVRSLSEDTLVICHGGPISEPKDVEFILKNTIGVVGFFGASSIERLAAERAITQQTMDFKSIKL
jgi:predicted TIM-barrel enzyme